MSEVVEEVKEEIAPEEQAARDFDRLYPVYERMLANLSRKGAIRVAKNLPTYPLVREKITFMDNKEKQVFELGMHLQDCKLTMMTAVLKERLKKEEAKDESTNES